MVARVSEFKMMTDKPEETSKPMPEASKLKVESHLGSAQLADVRLMSQSNKLADGFALQDKSPWLTDTAYKPLADTGAEQLQEARTLIISKLKQLA